MSIEVHHWPGFFCICFLAIVFLQSGFDKVFNYSKELGWIRQKFSRNFLHDYVGFLFLILTSLEIAAGLLCAAGVIQLLFMGQKTMAIFGAWAACLAMLSLIFGQRFTKDYTGAATLVPYFIVAIMGLTLLV